MSLKSTIQSLVNKTIVSSIGDLNTTATFRSTTTGTYDPTTGVVPRTISLYNCTCVSTKLSQNDVVDVTIINTGRKLLVPALQLTGVSVDSLDDEVDVDGARWLIKSAALDVAQALYTFVVVAQGGVQLLQPGVSVESYAFTTEDGEGLIE